MSIITTIVPIFLVVVIGWIARRKGFMPQEFWGPANRLVFYIAIPAMIFQAIARASLDRQFNPRLIVFTLLAASCGYLAGWLVARSWSLPANSRGSFIQCSGHGNLGYIGLAVAFYYLGEGGLVAASLLAGFVMILQNLLSVLALQSASHSANPGRPTILARQVLANPVIVAALAGISVSAFKIPIPLVVDRTLDILRAMALPTALLLIGASLSFDFIKSHKATVTAACLIKLILMPATGIILFKLAGFSSTTFLPALILLSSPTATIAYVMGSEMDGDADFAVAAISASTLISAVTFSLWLGIFNSF